MLKKKKFYTVYFLVLCSSSEKSFKSKVPNTKQSVHEVQFNLQGQVQNKFLHVIGIARINQALNVNGHHLL